MVFQSKLKQRLQELLIDVGLCAVVAGAGYWYGVKSTEKEWEDKVKQEQLRAEATTKEIKDEYSRFREDKEQEVKIIASRLDTALVGLRDRANRLPDAARAGCSGATGRELAGPDAGFLAGEAARTAIVEAALEQCYKSYDSAKSFIDTFNQRKVK
jgi:hypothetical protein